ncbi:MAG TPA: family 3 encapsulin nanocompartment shell protein [Actinophytocola sp.]|uniref:family 3 encapsulin nanocompartment shell protein n=1 Tax=Actinophytocola sp. TaxID=1872138 RepID=UPI002DDD51F6|nr:family 3 encapsulin nanocompartment shell protein [Actinophytocola sp.]HEV2783349.1 family 3 encapsulin nanocompartment shell protein [Actinophytocola sp.]
MTDAQIKQSRQVLADPSMTHSTPGEEFAQAAALSSNERDIVVPFRAYLPEAFPLFAHRPRFTVRHLMKMATVRDEDIPYIREPQPDTDDHIVSGTTFETTPESSLQPTLECAQLTDISVAVPVPARLLNSPRLLAAFIDYRLLVRFGTRENQILLHGDKRGAVPGLLTLSGMRSVRTGKDAVDVLASASAIVEETGGSCDGIVAHTAVYWQAVESGLLHKLTEAGIRIARTRMIPRDCVLLGDFRAAVTFLDPGVSALILHRRTEQDGTDTLEARSRMGLAVHLPQHFVLVEANKVAEV